jgi:hypothetical protein
MAGSLAGAALLAAATAAFIGDRPKLAVAALAGAGGAWWYAHTSLQALAADLVAAGQPAIDPRFVDSLQALLGPSGGAR